MYQHQRIIADAMSAKNLKFNHDMPNQRRGKSLAGLMAIKYCLAVNKSLAIGTANVDNLFDQVRLLFPEAKLTKKIGYLLVENEG